MGIVMAQIVLTISWGNLHYASRVPPVPVELNVNLAACSAIIMLVHTVHYVLHSISLHVLHARPVPTKSFDSQQKTVVDTLQYDSTTGVKRARINGCLKMRCLASFPGTDRTIVA